jgi:hypothetical protein
MIHLVHDEKDSQKRTRFTEQKDQIIKSTVAKKDQIVGRN